MTGYQLSYLAADGKRHIVYGLEEIRKTCLELRAARWQTAILSIDGMIYTVYLRDAAMHPLRLISKAMEDGCVVFKKMDGSRWIYASGHDVEGISC